MEREQYIMNRKSIFKICIFSIVALFSFIIIILLLKNYDYQMIMLELPMLLISYIYIPTLLIIFISSVIKIINIVLLNKNGKSKINKITSFITTIFFVFAFVFYSISMIAYTKSNLTQETKIKPYDIYNSVNFIDYKETDDTEYNVFKHFNESYLASDVEMVSKSFNYYDSQTESNQEFIIHVIKADKIPYIYRELLYKSAKKYTPKSLVKDESWCIYSIDNASSNRLCTILSKDNGSFLFVQIVPFNNQNFNVDEVLEYFKQDVLTAKSQNDIGN